MEWTHGLGFVGPRTAMISDTSLHAHIWMYIKSTHISNTDKHTYTHTHIHSCKAAGASYRQEVTVVIVSGPEGMGKRALAQRLIEEDPLERWVSMWMYVCAVSEGWVSLLGVVCCMDGCMICADGLAGLS